MVKILVVDDEPDIQKSVKLLLKNSNYEVEVAIDGDDCLKKTKSFNPDLIILDIMMPGTPVHEIIEQITNTKIIFLSAKQMTELEKSELMNHKNTIDYIKKPFNVGDLLNRVKTALKN